MPLCNWTESFKSDGVKSLTWIKKSLSSVNLNLNNYTAWRWITLLGNFLTKAFWEYLGKENVTQQRKKKETSNKKHMLGGTHIQFPTERGRWSHKEQGNKVETFLQLILPVILYSDFCFAFLIQKLDAQALAAIMKPCQLVIFTQEIKGREWRETKHSHLILKEALVEWRSSPVTRFCATHSKFPASTRRSTALNLRLLPSW